MRTKWIYCSVLIMLVCQFAVFGQTVSYTSSQDIVANPERGLQKYSITGSDYATTAGANNLAVSTLEGWKNSSDRVTVIFRYFLMEDFLNTNINSTYLSNIQTDFDNIRAAGLKTIVRFSYSNAQGSSAQQPTKAQILTHIDQLAPILNTNKDVILSHQAGFIGTWGEWYYTNSTEFGTDGVISSAQWSNRKEVVDAMLAATPEDIPLQVRYAGIKQTMYGNTQLNEVTAYQNTACARIGFFNDAFLNDWGDQGTYSVNGQCQDPSGTTDYNYVANETQYLPMTGETNGLNACNNGVRTTGANAILEMDATNWTTLNRDYYIPFWDGVIASNHYDEIVKRLGYRFNLISSTVSANSSNFDFSLELENVGFARLIKQRDVYLILEDTTTNAITSVNLNTDCRTWENTVSINQNISVGVPGTFHLYLWMPDPEVNLQSNSDYSIQCANTGLWDAATGYNDLMQTVTIDSAASVNNLGETRILTVYPNPSKDYLIIELHEDVPGQLAIYDVSGKLILEIDPKLNEKIWVGNLKKGLYFIKSSDGNQIYSTWMKE